MKSAVGSQHVVWLSELRHVMRGSAYAVPPAAAPVVVLGRQHVQILHLDLVLKSRADQHDEAMALNVRALEIARALQGQWSSGDIRSRGCPLSASAYEQHDRMVQLGGAAAALREGTSITLIRLGHSWWSGGALADGFACPVRSAAWKPDRPCLLPKRSPSLRPKPGRPHRTALLRRILVLVHPDPNRAPAFLAAAQSPVTFSGADVS
jgi:hypothetical protein